MTHADWFLWASETWALSLVHVTSLIYICRNLSQASVSHVHYIIWFSDVLLASGVKKTPQKVSGYIWVRDSLRWHITLSLNARRQAGPWDEMHCKANVSFLPADIWESHVWQVTKSCHYFCLGNLCLLWTQIQNLSVMTRKEQLEAGLESRNFRGKAIVTHNSVFTAAGEPVCIETIEAKKSSRLDDFAPTRCKSF